MVCVFDELWLCLDWPSLCFPMLDLRYWDMCGDTSKKGFPETFCSWYLDSFYIKPILLDTLFSKFVVYLFCNKHSSNNTRQNDCSLSTISLPIFKVDRVGGWLSLWVGLRKKKNSPVLIDMNHCWTLLILCLLFQYFNTLALKIQTYIICKHDAIKTFRIIQKVIHL